MYRAGQRVCERAIPAILCGLIACPYAYTGVEMTELEPIRVGASRADVERALGEPTEEDRTREERIATYAFNTGEVDWGEEEGEPLFGKAQDGLHVSFLGGAFWYLTPFGSWIAWAMQRGELTVVYGPDDRVLGFRISPTAMHHYGEVMVEERRPDQAFFWLCLAAVEKHGESALLLGRLYDSGLRGFGSNERAALYWYAVAVEREDPYASWYVDEISTRVDDAEAVQGEASGFSVERCRNVPEELEHARGNDTHVGGQP